MRGSLDFDGSLWEGPLNGRSVHLDELHIRTDLMVRSFEFRRLARPIRELLLERGTVSGREVHRLARRVGRSRRMKLRIWVTYRARRIAHGTQHTLHRIVYTT